MQELQDVKFLICDLVENIPEISQIRYTIYDRKNIWCSNQSDSIQRDLCFEFKSLVIQHYNKILPHTKALNIVTFKNKIINLKKLYKSSSSPSSVLLERSHRLLSEFDDFIITCSKNANKSSILAMPIYEHIIEITNHLCLQNLNSTILKDNIANIDDFKNIKFYCRSSKSFGDTLFVYYRSKCEFLVADNKKLYIIRNNKLEHATYLGKSQNWKEKNINH